jgi:hypothetical protein
MDGAVSQICRYSGGLSPFFQGICRRPAFVADVSAIKILYTSDNPSWRALLFEAISDINIFFKTL